eukprot:scaffold295534_cov22-Tisochrysis_lutea.AAC.1
MQARPHRDLLVQVAHLLLPIQNFLLSPLYLCLELCGSVAVRAGSSECSQNASPNVHCTAAAVVAGPALCMYGHPCGRHRLHSHCCEHGCIHTSLRA